MTLVMVKAVIILFLVTLSSFRLTSGRLSFAQTAAEQQELVVHYANTWAVEVRGGTEEANELALKHGLINRGQVGNLQHCYLFMEGDTAREVTKNLATNKTIALYDDEEVESVKQQMIKKKVKKDYTSPSDPGWRRQWSLENTGQNGPSGLDLNVEPAWMQGITGQGVVVGLVDDGMDWRHSDLIRNYDSSASRDFLHYDSDPTPDYDSEEPNSHGTECAGVVGMTRNSICGIGVAHHANIGSLKFDVGGATDAVEASAVGYKDYYIDVYSNSWGPSDFGFIVDGPGTLLQRTLATGVTEGRGGKGNIYVWAAGNGGHYFDSCAADGYSSSIYTIAAGSADQDGRQADYDEDCSAKMVVTFSYNSDTFPGEYDSYDPYNQVYTTTLGQACTDGFTGTSASTPLVSGVIALTLQANSDLTWRDVQYLLAYTSNPDILVGGAWITNGGGLKVSPHFGFGAIDAEAMVTRAKHWTNVPEQHTKTVYSSPSSASIYYTLTRTFSVTESSFSSSDRISSLEHVVVTMSLSIEGVSYFSTYDYDDIYDYTGDLYDWLQDRHPRRGDIKIELTSPHRTKSILLPYRNYDFINEEGYDNWPFMSVHFWGENPVGTWTLKITYKSGSGYVRMTGLSMKLHGTSSIPTAVSSIPTVCHSSCARSCFGEGSNHCDSCRHYRIATTLECVDQCPSNTHAYKKYCYADDNVTPSTPTTEASQTSETSPTNEATSSIPTGKTENTTTSSATSERPSTTTSEGSSNASSGGQATTTPTHEGESATSSSKQRSTTSTRRTNNTLPLAIGIPVGFAVAIATIALLGGVIYKVYIKKRKVRSDGFILMTTEVET